MFVGWRTEYRQVVGGDFYCPKCKGQFPYGTFVVSRLTYFRLLFWTLWESAPRLVRRYVQCGGCGAKFGVDILQPYYGDLLNLVAIFDNFVNKGMNYDAVRQELTTICGDAKVADLALQRAIHR